MDLGRGIGVHGRRWIGQYSARPEFGLGTAEVSGPYFVFIGTHGKTYRAVVLPGKVRKTAACIDYVTGLSDRVHPGLGVSVIGNSIGRAELPAGFAAVTERGNTDIDR